MQVESRPDYFSADLEGRPTHVYNESAFRHFLSIERKRSERSGRPFALLLIDGEAPSAAAGRSMNTETAARLFSALSLCLRETDFIGWYQEGNVAGAVLTHLGDTSGPDFIHRVRRRISSAVFAGFPQLAEAFALRLYQLPAQDHELGEDRS